MERILILLTVFLPVAFAYGQANNAAKIKANYDERIELMSILCHLAGFDEYNMGMGGDYTKDIDNYFAGVKNHPAVEMMDSLRRHKGVSYDSPMSFAINLKKSGNDFILFNDTVPPETRWKGVDLEKATSLISDFYKDSNFSNFFDSHKPFYEEVCGQFDSGVISKFNQNWYKQYYGVPPTENFEIVIGFTNGGANYGPSLKLPDQPRDVYAIIGYALDDNGKPYYISEPGMYLNTLVHEFNHSFVNPLSADSKFASDMEKATQPLLTYSEKVMRMNAYSTWQTLVNESIVRASVILYLLDNGEMEEDIRKSVIDEMSTGFYWTPDLVKCLQNYSIHRKKYPTIDSYYPKIIEFFRDYSNNCTKKINAIFK